MVEFEDLRKVKLIDEQLRSLSKSFESFEFQRLKHCLRLRTVRFGFLERELFDFAGVDNLLD